ncbi:MAG TPA: MipA/OmpV family protein [Stellaceae bacterium]|nr:MipA/OmpV family protein [Stellaceae bacterium]
MLKRQYGWAIAGALGLALVSGGARAQSMAPLLDWQNSAGIVLRSLGGPVPEWEIAVGGGGGVLPAYEGSNSLRFAPALLLDVRYRDIFFVSSGEGVGVNLLHGDYYRAGVALAFDPGREHNAATRLSGTGNIDPAPEPKIFAQFAIVPVVFTFDLRYRATSQQGFVGDVGVYMPVIGNKTVQVFVGPSVTFADDDYMNTYFGVTPRHAAPHSQFPTFQAHGGFKNANFGLTALYHFTDHWFVDLDAGIERLLGSAADSPLIQTKWGVGANAEIAYEF